MFGGRTIGTFRAISASVSLALVTSALLSTASGAALTAKLQSPPDWTEKFCTGLVQWQADALDARDAAFPVVGAAPADRAGVKMAAVALDTALKPPAKAIGALTATLERRQPKGKHGVAVGDALAAGVGKLADAYATARKRAVALKSTRPPQFVTQAPRVLTKLDADLDRATKPILKLEKRVATSSVAESIGANVACRRIGFDWSTLGATVGAGSAPATVDPASPGAADQTAPAVLLPARYRPTPDIAALAARTTMTGLGRLYFYGAEPEVLTGQLFATSCPSAEASTQQILGCYRDHRIYVLSVTRPELVTVVDVTAAHEMLHAVYEDLDTAQHGDVDPKLSALYDSTRDVHIHQIVPLYQRRTPLNVPNEMHSLIGTQVGTLTPELDTYYAQFFKDRSQIVNAYVAYVSVFDNLLNRYHELDVQLGDLRDQINGLRSQAQTAGGEAQRLGSQIDALRAQGRVNESNALVGPQNAAARQANGLVAQANGLIEQYNGLIAEINGIASQLGGLDSALRPFG